MKGSVRQTDGQTDTRRSRQGNLHLKRNSRHPSIEEGEEKGEEEEEERKAN